MARSERRPDDERRLVYIGPCEQQQQRPINRTRYEVLKAQPRMFGDELVVMICALRKVPEALV